MLYVTMTDKNLSGWGRAKGTINKLVISCDTFKEAEIVEANAHDRPEMIHINICNEDPTARYKRKGYYVSNHGRKEGDAQVWFKPKAFIHHKEIKK